VKSHADAQPKAFLPDHRYAEAAALFEFRGEWEMLPKRECLNNRGSCWISDDPERAMYFLQRAAASGYVPVAVNVYNQMCCKVAMGDTLGIRALSENYWSERFEDNAIHATLWSLRLSVFVFAFPQRANRERRQKLNQGP
jgi:hypothetical protein